MRALCNRFLYSIWFVLFMFLTTSKNIFDYSFCCAVYVFSFFLLPSSFIRSSHIVIFKASFSPLLFFFFYYSFVFQFQNLPANVTNHHDRFLHRAALSNNKYTLKNTYTSHCVISTHKRKTTWKTIIYAVSFR